MNLSPKTVTLFAAQLVLACSISACGQEQETVVAAPDTAPKINAALPRTSSPHGARVFFISPSDGETLSSPLNIEFGIQGMTVVKAGNDQTNSGHHHLLIDTALPNTGLPIPADAHHIHFGDGSAQTRITLAPGEHRLQLLLGDHHHIPHNPPVVSKSIRITVE